MRVRIGRYGVLMAAVAAASAVVVGCTGVQNRPQKQDRALAAGCAIDDGSTTADYSGDDIAASYDVVAQAIADGTAVQPPDSQTIPLLDGTDETATECEGCSDVVITGPAAPAQQQTA